MALLEVRRLSKVFGGISAVDGLDFTVDGGGILSIIGPNGAGKTTLFNVLTGVYTPTEGHVFLEGEDVTHLTPFERAAKGMSRTFQNVQAFLNMSAVENVMVGYHLHSHRRFFSSLLRTPKALAANKMARDKAADLMEYVGLGEYVGMAADSLPYGALKRLEIARALATEPKILMLDEPAAGLNPTETQALDDLIQEIAANGVTILLVEHDMRLVMGISDHIIVLDHGRWLAEGNAQEIRANPEVTAAYLGEEGRGH